MKSTSVVRGVAVILSVCLILLFSGCGGQQMHQADANRPWDPARRPTSIDETQLAPLLTKLSHLQMASQEAMEAAKLIGTPEHELTEAQQAHMSGEQWLQDGTAAYRAKQYVQSWNTLEAANAAFRRAEEAAVRAGLAQLEQELVAVYGRLLTPDARVSPQTSGDAARVSQPSVNIREGAGTDFQVIGRAQLGDTLNILTESGEWYRVRTGTGLIGWVSKILVIRIQHP
jgi:murein L,D-transpeptidase YcbB/YkuD